MLAADERGKDSSNENSFNGKHLMGNNDVRKNIRFVMVETSHPGNIGAAARALKVMGLDNLVLVRPRFFPHEEATARASGADDVLSRVQVYDTLPEALSGCSLVIGASARLRSMQWPQLDARQAGKTVVEEGCHGQVALVFGRESTGLTNTELGYCQYLMHIPANPEYSSLNVASALQIMAYEVNMALGQAPENPGYEIFADDPPATSDEVEGMYVHLEQALKDLHFLKPDKSPYLMQRLRRLFNRARMTRNEVNIMRGILGAAQGKKQPKD